MQHTISLALWLGLAIAAVSIALYELFAVEFSHLFMKDPQTLALASQFLRIRVLATPLMFLSFFTVHLFQAFGKGRTALLFGRDPLAGVQYPHAVSAQRPLRHVRPGVVPGGGGLADGAPVGLRLLEIPARPRPAPDPKLKPARLHSTPENGGGFS